MKKILVLGGVGAMATESTIDLVETSNFEEIMIADIDLQKIESFIGKVGDSRLRAVKIDAQHVERMAELMEGYQVVANGLPRIFCENAIQAAIKAGVDMLDLISPHEETLALDQDARSAGVSVVGGVGITPGITNILAQLGAERLVRVERIDIDFAAFRSIAHSPGLLHVILWEFDPRTENRFFYDGGQLIPGRSEDTRGACCRLNCVRQAPVTVVTELSVSQVDLLLTCTVSFIRNIAHDTDDGEVFAAGSEHLA